MTAPSDEPAHYYAGRQRIDLVPSSAYVAIDPTKATGLGEARLESLSRAGDPLAKGVLLLRRSDITEDETESLERAGGKIPVYDWCGTLLIPLPKIVIPAPQNAHDHIMARIDALADIPVTRKASDGNRLILVPASGQALDALRLAARLAEGLRGIEVSPDFLRVYA